MLKVLVGEDHNYYRNFCNTKMNDLEPILKFKMNEMEAKAFKIALIWEQECRRELADEQFVKLKKNADPRKSTLFKYCYKLARETNGIIEEPEIPLYVRAQIQILKSIKEGQVHALVEPHCLVGEKAWKRWKLWKYKFRKKLNKSLNSEELGILSKESKVIAELKKSYDFLKKRSCLQFEEFLNNKKSIMVWLSNGELSHFYASVSPWVKKVFADLSELNFDDKYYRASITPEVEKFFREKFSHEYI
jgi:hypothetical protein